MSARAAAVYVVLPHGRVLVVMLSIVAVREPRGGMGHVPGSGVGPTPEAGPARPGGRA